MCLPMLPMYLILSHDGELSRGAEGIGAIVHDGTIIVGESSGVRILLNVKVELDTFLRVSIFPQH